MHGFENSHLALPLEDWDHKDGSVQDHKNRMEMVKKETLSVILVNGFFSLLTVIPSLILSKFHQLLFNLNALTMCNLFQFQM